MSAKNKDNFAESPWIFTNMKKWAAVLMPVRTVKSKVAPALLFRDS